MAKVSIVAPVYGVEKYINQFLESIRNQTFQDLEVILVDDGSKDRCPQILDEFVKEDSRYHVIHQENAGVSVARNKGLEYITGEYVYIVDSDDWLTCDAIEQLYLAAQRTDADIIYGDWIMEKDSGETKRRICFPNEFVTSSKETIKMLQCGVFTNDNNNISRPEFQYINHLGGAPWRALIKTSLITNNNLKFDPYVRGLGDDILFILHLYEYVKKVAYIQHPIYHYRIISASYSHGYKANYLETVNRIYERMEEFLNKTKKDNVVWSFYYYRVLIYFQQGMVRYFKNTNNPVNEKERFKEFKEVLQSKPYCDAVRKAPLSMIRNKKTRYSLWMLRLKLYKLYWILKR